MNLDLMRLCLVTDRGLSRGRSLVDVAGAARVDRVTRPLGAGASSAAAAAPTRRPGIAEEGDGQRHRRQE